MTPDEQYDTSEALEGLLARAPHYRTYRNYYDGKHPTALTHPKLELAFGRLLNDYRDNLCGTVVDAAADRLRIEGWTAEDSVVERITDLERRVRFTRTQGEAFEEAITTGDSFLLVWPDRTGKPRIYGQPAHTCAVTYDPEDPTVILSAVKLWRERDRYRLNLYFPDRIERLVTEAETETAPKDLAKYVALADDPFVTNPYDEVPVYHLAPNAAAGCVGRSDLANVLPIQDALNKADVDILVLGEFYGGPLRALIGVDAERDSNGNKIKPRVAPGDLLELPEGASLTQLDPSDIEKLLATSDHWAAKLSRVSSTPVHLLGLASTVDLSGEALNNLERPLTDRVKDHQDAFEDPVAGAMRMALRQDGIADPGDPRPVWAPAETVTEERKLSNAEAKLRVGYSQERVLSDLGESAAVVAEMLAANEVAADQAASRVATSFSAGLVP
jgi:hypothetical protein